MKTFKVGNIIRSIQNPYFHYEVMETMKWYDVQLLRLKPIDLDEPNRTYENIIAIYDQYLYNTFKLVKA